MNALETTLKQLRLSGLIQTLDVRLQEAAANRLNHAEFLELICQDELNVRQQRQMERHTKLADFRHLKTLDDFDWSFNPSVHKKEIFDLATCRFIREANAAGVAEPPLQSNSGDGELLDSYSQTITCVVEKITRRGLISCPFQQTPPHNQKMVSSAQSCFRIANDSSPCRRAGARAVSGDVFPAGRMREPAERAE